MGDASAGGMIDRQPILAAELKARADQLAAILTISSDTYAGHDAEAYQVMGHLAAMPTIQDHGRRRQYGNEI